MPLLFRHFALALIAVTIANAVIVSRRVAALLPDVRDRHDAARLIWEAAAVLSVLFMLLELLTIVSGADSPLCFLPLRGHLGPRQYVSWTVWVGWTVGVTSWVVLGSGADRVARYASLFSRTRSPNVTYRPRTIRLLATAWCVATLGVPFLVPSDQPIPLTCPELVFSIRAL